MTQTAGQIRNQKNARPKAAFPRKAAGAFSWGRLGPGNWPRVTKILLLMALMVLPLLTLQSMRLGHEVVQRLEGLSTAATDNMQWVLSQAEVDHLKLEAALDAAEEPGGITALRRQFDVYYSRIATFVEGPLFADLRNSPAGGKLLGRLQGRLESLVELIDVPDQQLMKNRHLIAMHLLHNGDDVRELALFGVVIQVEDTESKRLQLFAIMWRLAVVLLALIIALAVTALLSGWMYRRGRRLAEERSKASSRMEAMISSSLDAILMIDQESRILAFNGAAEAIFGYRRAEVMGAKMDELIIPPHLREVHRAGMKRLEKKTQPSGGGSGAGPAAGAKKVRRDLPDGDVAFRQSQRNRPSLCWLYS